MTEVLLFAVILGYLIAGIRLLKEVKPVLKPKVFRRYFAFFNGFLAYSLILSAYNLLSIWVFTDVLPASFLELSRFLFKPLGILIYMATMMFVILESSEFRALFFGENLLKNKELIEWKPAIEDQVKAFLFDQKMFKEPDLRIKDVASNVGVGDKALSEYFQNEYKASFHDFINLLRIEEFKRLSRNPRYSNLSLSGIAQESGFRSKATFYRAFKKMEGITPNEYVTNQKL